MSRAKRQEVDVLALTDHDTTIGLARAAKKAEEEGIELITGIEFSCQWAGRNIHMLGLNFDLNSECFKKAVESQAELRETRAVIIADKLAAAGFDGALEGARTFAGSGIIGRPHFAQFMVEKGYSKSVAQCFKKYLGAGKIGDVKQIWPEIEDVVRVVVDAGGVAAIAHPHKYKMTRTKLCAMVADFKEAGGTAIEVISGQQHRDVTRDLASIARKYELAASCGSDFHAPGNQWQELGRIPSLPEDLTPVWDCWS